MIRRNLCILFLTASTVAAGRALRAQAPDDMAAPSAPQDAAVPDRPAQEAPPSAPDNADNANSSLLLRNPPGDSQNGTNPGGSGTLTMPGKAGGSDWAPPAASTLEYEPADPLPTQNLPSLEARGMNGDGNMDTSETDAAAAAALAPRVEMGGPGTPKWKVIYYVSERTTVDDNIFISHTNKKSDTYFTISPGFAAGWGDFRKAFLLNSSRFANEFGQTRLDVIDPDEENYAYVNYTGSGTLFVDNSGQDAFDHDLSLATQWGFAKLMFGFTARFQTLSGPDVDVGTRTKRDILTLAATGRYSLSDKSSLEVDLGGSVREYQTELNSQEWQDQNWFDYQIQPKTSLGGGVAFGLREQQDSPSQTYEQFQLRATYAVTGKLAVRINGGVELDQADGTNRFNPVFGAGLTYALGDQDSISLDAFRQTSSSAQGAGQSLDNMGVNLTLKHRIYSAFAVALQGGYQHSAYHFENASTLLRKDDYFFLRPSLTYDFGRWSQVELAYELHKNTSSESEFSFTENLASLQLNFVF